MFLPMMALLFKGELPMCGARRGSGTSVTTPRALARADDSSLVALLLPPTFRC